MTTDRDIVARAERELGYVERPVNRNKFGAFFGRDGEPWCAFFVAWVFLMCGIDLRKFCDNVGYTPNLFGDLKALGFAVSKTAIRAADIVFFRFTNRINHVGIATGPGSTIDGNTGTGGTREYNGGGVARKNRGTAQVAGVIRMPLATSPTVAQATATLRDLRNAIDFSKAVHLGGPGDTNPPAVVKILQAGLNRWADQFAAMTGSPNPPDIPVDGVWGPATWDAVTAVQRLTGRNDGGKPGTVGPNTWATLYP